MRFKLALAQCEGGTYYCACFVHVFLSVTLRDMANKINKTALVILLFTFFSNKYNNIREFHITEIKYDLFIDGLT